MLFSVFVSFKFYSYVMFFSVVFFCVVLLLTMSLEALGHSGKATNSTKFSAKHFDSLAPVACVLGLRLSTQCISQTITFITIIFWRMFFKM